MHCCRHLIPKARQTISPIRSDILASGHDARAAGDWRRPVNILGINSVFHEFSRRVARRRQARRRRRGGTVQSHQTRQVSGIRQPTSISRTRDPFLPEPCRAYRPRYRSRGLFVQSRRCAKSNIAPSGGIRGLRKRSGCGLVRCAVLPRSFLDVRFGKNFISCPTIWHMPLRRIFRQASIARPSSPSTESAR